MRIIFFITLCFFIAACGKQTSAPSYNNTNSDTANQHGVTKPTSSISVAVNNVPMTVTSISYNRSSGTFNFSAQNSLQKVEVNCFWFYQQSGFNYMFSDSVTYATRPDTLTNWHTITARPDMVNFDGLIAPLTDKKVTGEYSGDFSSGKNELKIEGNFYLLF